MPENRLYTVYRCASMSSDAQKGPLHASDDRCVTRCGKWIDERWYIKSNTSRAKSVTCKKCRLALDKQEDLDRA